MCENTSLSATTAAIEAAFDGRWGVWLSDTGWWWAARTHALTAEELTTGCVPFLHADNPDELTERIRQQQQLTRPDPKARDHNGDPQRQRRRHQATTGTRHHSGCPPRAPAT